LVYRGRHTKSDVDCGRSREVKGAGVPAGRDGDGLAQRMAVAMGFAVERVGVAHAVGVEVGPYGHLRRG